MGTQTADRLDLRSTIPRHRFLVVPSFHVQYLKPLVSVTWPIDIFLRRTSNAIRTASTARGQVCLGKRVSSLVTDWLLEGLE
ncbi:hypothetical protein [Natrinema pallidum]|uniref:Uncharacterized protein n=1 Tax=Natrinema pallidum TaxID=69527 RepID=A0A4P9TD62_9EURY|nr:hypothetical protein [Natrinema pallidum]QCW02666.1 hypothetical protein FGF80_05205 [Natrinema pallidum]